MNIPISHTDKPRPVHVVPGVEGCYHFNPGRKLPHGRWTVVLRGKSTVQHEHRQTERQARELLGLIGGSDDIYYVP